MGPLRGGAGETSGSGSAAPGRAAVALSLRDHPDIGLYSGTRAKQPWPQIAVLIPELVERHWYHYFLHNQRAEWLRALLLAKGNQQVILVNVPWYANA